MQRARSTRVAGPRDLFLFQRELGREEPLLEHVGELRLPVVLVHDARRLPVGVQELRAYFFFGSGRSLETEAQFHRHSMQSGSRGEAITI